MDKERYCRGSSSPVTESGSLSFFHVPPCTWLSMIFQSLQHESTGVRYKETTKTTDSTAIHSFNRSTIDLSMLSRGEVYEGGPLFFSLFLLLVLMLKRWLAVAVRLDIDLFLEHFS